MIPKIIHYIWLGKNDKSSLNYICLHSWKEKLPDYQIKEWNEETLQLDALCRENRFLAECRKRKLWAYMADYLRLYILYREGGIYLDTDVQVMQSFDFLLTKDAFFGLEANGFYGTGVIAANRHNPAIQKMLEFYKHDIWMVDFYTIPYVMHYVAEQNQETFVDVTVYPQEYFAPYEYDKEFDLAKITKNTYAIHWFGGTWTENKQVCLFLQTKHIKNPILQNLLKIKKGCGYYYRKMMQ